MKNLKILTSLFAITFLLIGCQPGAPQQGVDENQTPAVGNYEDGTYRGVFIDGDEIQVNVQFSLNDNNIESISFRHLYYNGQDYLETEDETIESLTSQHEQVLESIQGTNITEALEELYDPVNLAEDIDGFTAATLRANKIRSAIQDGLNRGLYVKE
ncbi:FMN-binding protein [Proteinivorax tanatarense]|uniref:FMN-binding protein n=1 Tax=Proteinivorax tanatarense TaxID=1260629 RepID=A0AAU7VQ48_9FIRM